MGMADLPELSSHPMDGVTTTTPMAGCAGRSCPQHVNKLLNNRHGVLIELLREHLDHPAPLPATTIQDLSGWGHLDMPENILPSVHERPSTGRHDPASRFWGVQFAKLNSL